jgi:hypothetical protein
MPGDSVRIEGPDYIRMVSIPVPDVFIDQRIHAIIEDVDFIIPVPDVFIDQGIDCLVCSTFAGRERNFFTHKQGGHIYITETLSSGVSHEYL